MEENENVRAARKSFSFSGWALLTALLIPVLLNVLIGVLAQVFPAGLIENRLFLWAISFLPVFGFGIPAGLLMMKHLPRDLGEQKKMGLKSFLIAFIMCYPMMLGGNVIGTFAAQIFSGGRSTSNVVELIAQQDPLIMLTLTIAAPLLEELIFRKCLIDHTIRFGEKNAILFSALAFGLFHCNLYQIFYAFGIGLIFGYIYVRTRNVRYTMIMHFLINFSSGVIGALLMGRVDPEMMELMMGENTDAMITLMTEDPQAMMAFAMSVLPLMLMGFMNIVLAIAGTVLLGTQKKKFVFEIQPREVSGKQGIRAALLNAGFLTFVVFALAYTAYVLAATC